MMSDRVAADGSGLNSITLATGGLIVGAAAVALLGRGRHDAADVHHQRRRGRGDHDAVVRAGDRARA